MNYFKVDHFTGLRGLGFFTSVQHGYSVRFNLLFQVAQFLFHFIAAAHLANEFPLKSFDIRIRLTIDKSPGEEEGTKKNTIDKKSEKNNMCYIIIVLQCTYLRDETEPDSIHRVRIRWAHASSLSKNNWHRTISSLRNSDPVAAIPWFSDRKTTWKPPWSSQILLTVTKK
ncbi:unnamed protein product [Macrosiphum euphorbiae]|uniref:Uncharacterized protein n=1 Tax=Macrosiphum euphorbiae TaxID=13131 RepID=A0AAV0XWR6_9HEMI|nr:unnamed protein product [Macrosiphum euphorbiae]